jgi:hypothetical protein
MILSSEEGRVRFNSSSSGDGSGYRLGYRREYCPIHINQEPVRRFRTTGNVKLKYCAVALTVHMS